MTETMQGPLAGIRIVDLTSVFFGPYATQMLGDLGADVIKVESPEGDIIRGLEPARNPGMGAIFLNANRNKRSLSLDLKQEAARAALLKVAAGADVFVHSMRPQAIARLGLAYADLQAVNAEIIYCSAWGYARGGPYAAKPAYDDVVQALSGVTDLPSQRDSEAEPDYVPMAIADKVGGLTLTQAITAALFHRLRTGEGQEVEVPMFEAFTAFTLVEHLAGGAFEEAMGYERYLVTHRRPYRTADGYIAVLPYKMGIHPPNECQYSLGYYRPGNCAPYMLPPIPWSLRGAAAQAGFVTGAAGLIP